MFDLSGKVTIVTGASRGIGRAIAVTLAGQGALVVAAARGDNAADTVAAIVNAEPLKDPPPVPPKYDPSRNGTGRVAPQPLDYRQPEAGQHCLKLAINPKPQRDKNNNPLPPPQAAKAALPAPAIMYDKKFLRVRGALILLVTLNREFLSCVLVRGFEDTENYSRLLKEAEV